MSNSISNRQAFCETLITMAQTDKDIVVLTSDSCGSAGLTPFVEKYKDRHIEVGIAEQNIVGIASGLATCGKKPVVASPACFLSMRSAEQIKVDVAYSNNNVLLLGISGGVSYGALGSTHHSLQDIALMCAIPNLEVILPADRYETAEITKDILNNPRPVYMRIGRNAVEDVYKTNNTGYKRGKGTWLSACTTTAKATIIATGELVRTALDASVILQKQNIEVAVLNLHTLKPIDTESILKATQTGFILTMEEHSIFGGLNSLVSQVACANNPVPVHALSISDEPALAGASKEVFEHYGLTAQNGAEIILSHLREKGESK